MSDSDVPRTPGEIFEVESDEKPPPKSKSLEEILKTTEIHGVQDIFDADTLRAKLLWLGVLLAAMVGFLL